MENIQLAGSPDVSDYRILIQKLDEGLQPLLEQAFKFGYEEGKTARYRETTEMLTSEFEKGKKIGFSEGFCEGKRVGNIDGRDSVLSRLKTVNTDLKTKLCKYIGALKRQESCNIIDEVFDEFMKSYIEKPKHHRILDDVDYSNDDFSDLEET